MSSDAKVEQRHRQMAVTLAACDASDAFLSSSGQAQAFISVVEQALANAEAAGYAQAREDAAKVCECKVKRPAGHRGQWEGYGGFDGDMTGPECAAAIRAMRGTHEGE